MGPKDGDDGNLQRGGQVQRTRIAADEQLRPTRERDQFCDRNGEGFGCSSTRCFGFGRQLVLARSVIHDRLQTAAGQRASDRSVTLSLATASRPSQRPG